ncbi:MAG: Na+/H+ antiporter subunit D [Acidimicrobiia bacterium]|nr:Na+/H+ antiporter subunit D [Acidimicrobiia bacterium]
MKTLVTLPLVVPLAAAALSLLMRRFLVAQRVLGITAATASLGIALALVVRVDGTGPAVAALGGWHPPLGIALVADRFAALMLVVAAAALLGVLVYAVGQGRVDTAMPGFHPVYQVLAAGVALGLLTGDLFTLFVAFEVMLIASYVLITARAGAAHVRATLTYVVVGLTASALFLATVALIYAAAGTVNLADLAGRLDGVSPTIRAALGWLLFMVFGIKAAIFPLFFWLPDSYPTAPSPVTAIFAGLLTKVGVYAMIRTQTLLFPSDEPSQVMLALAGLTMVVGVLGAIAQSDIRRILSFHIVSQIGYMVMGLGFFTVAGLAAAIVFLVHQIVVKTVLFLVGGLVEDTAGTGNLAKVGGVLHRHPLVALLYLPAALSLAGLPPFSGFVGKLALVQAGFAASQAPVVAVSLAASILTLFSMAKIWAGAFWGQPTGEDCRRPGAVGLAATGALVVASLAIAVVAQPLLGLATRAGADLLAADVYRAVVLGG